MDFIFLELVFGHCSRNRLKKTGAGAACEKNQEPEPEKNYPAPQPCF